MTTTQDEIARVYLKRLKMLRDIAVPFVRKMSQKRKLRWNFWFKGDPETPCGSYACLLGYAASLPEFRKDGWDLEYYRDEEGVAQYFPRFDGDTQDDAAIEYFGITLRECESIFGPSEFGTLRQREKRIQRLIDERERELGSG